MKKILYLHGFEEIKTSPKPTFLTSQFGAKFLDLGMYFTKRNSVLRYGLTSIPALKILACTVIGGLLSTHFGVSCMIPCIASLVISLYYYRKCIVAEGVKGAFNKTLSLAEEEIKSTQPDLIIGFSWGGAIATKLLCDQTYKGNVLLLAPAGEKLNEITSSSLLSYPTSIKSKITIIHCTDDTIVPLSHSRMLKTKFSSVNLLEVSGQGHKLWGTIEDGTLKQSVSELL